MGLGPVDEVSLADARGRAAECRKLRENGIDPIEYRKAAQVQEALEAAKSMTFDQCRDLYIRAHAPPVAEHASELLQPRIREYAGSGR